MDKWTDEQTNKRTGRYKDRQTIGQMGSCIEGQTDRETDEQMDRHTGGETGIRINEHVNR